MTYEGNCRLGDLFSSRREKGRPGLPTLSVTLNNGLVNREDLDRKQETNLSPEEHLLVKPGDIAYNMMRMWQGAHGLASENGIVSPAYVVLKPKNGIDSLYASYLFQTKRMAYLFWAYSYGLTDDRLRLYFDDFARIPVQIQSSKEQEYVANLLATWDDAIATLRKLRANSQKQKASLVSKLISPASNWSTAMFDQIFVVSNQKAAQICSGDYLEAGAIPIVDQGQNLIAGYSNDNSTYVVPPVIIFGDHTRVVKWVDFPFRPGADGTQLLRTTGIVHPKFAFHLLANTPIQNLGYSRHMRMLKETTFRVPKELDVQAHIAEQLDAANQAISNIDANIDLLVKEKRALMQQLLTGKRRVRIPAAEATP